MGIEPTSGPAAATGRVHPFHSAIQHDPPPGRSRRLFTALALAAGAAIALGACASSHPTATTTAGSETAAFAAARCMRAHGISNFPDPGPKGGMTVLFTPDSSNVTIDGIPFSGPAFNAAAKICEPLGNAGSGRPPVTEQQRRALLNFARCMRQHGIAFADPQFPAGGGIFGGGGSDQDNNSPAVKHAAAICNTAMRSGNAG